MSNVEELNSEPELIEMEDGYENTAHYVITVDGDIIANESSLESAQDRAMELANEYREYHPEFHNYVDMVSDHEIQLSRRYKNYLTSYDEIYKTIEIHDVWKIVV